MSGQQTLERRKQMSTLQARMYGALAGALLGLGAVTIFSVGIGLVLLGAVLLLIAARKTMLRSDSLLLWVAVAAMGLAPAILLTFNYVSADHTTDVYFSDPWSSVLIFAAIGLAGIAGGVITTASRQPR